MSDTASITRISEILGSFDSTIFTFNVEFRAVAMPVEVQFFDAAKRLLRDGVTEEEAAGHAIRVEVEAVPPSEDWRVMIAASPISLDENLIRELGLAAGD